MVVVEDEDMWIAFVLAELVTAVALYELLELGNRV